MYNSKDKLKFLSKIKQPLSLKNVSSKVITIDQELTGGNYWTTKANLPSVKWLTDAFTLNGFSYVCGGNNGSNLSEVNQYNDNLNSWTSKANILSIKSQVSCKSLNGFGYILNGHNGSVISENNQYNDFTNIWTNKATNAQSSCANSSFVLNSFLYLVNGYMGSTSYSSSVYQYNDELNIWNTKSNSLLGKYASSSFTLNNFGYISNGLVFNNVFVSDVHQYNDSIDTWNTKKNFGSSKDYCMGFTLNGFGYSCVGISSIGSTLLSEVHQYNDSADNWLSKANTGTAKYGPAVFTLNGFSYECGGFNGSSGVSEVNQYRDSNLYEILTTFRKSNKTPVKVLVGTNLNGVPTTIPIQITTTPLVSGNTVWNNMESNVDSILKTGISLVQTISANSSGWRDYRIRVGIPSTFQVSGGSYNGYWVQKTNAGTARSSSRAFNLNGFGYNCVGNTGSDSSEVNQYNDNTNIWINKNNASFSLKQGASFCINGFGYLMNSYVGISNSSTTIQYTDIIDTWNTKANTLIAKRDVSGISLNGFGYIFNGYTSIETSTTEQYNDAANIWTNKNNSPLSRIAIAAFSLNGFGYLCDGINVTSTTNYSQIDQYNDAANIWTTKANSGVVRNSLSGFNLNSFGYIAGGSNNGGVSFISQVEQYNDAANIWTTKPNFGTARYVSASFALNNFGYFISGYSGINSSEVNQYVTNTKLPVLSISLYVDETDQMNLSLVDPTKWIGAWDFNTVGNPNVISISAGLPYLLGAFDTNSGKYPVGATNVGVLSTYLNTGGYSSSRVVEQIISSGSVADVGTIGTVPVSSNFSLSQFTFGAWVKKENSATNPDNTMHTDSSSAAATTSLGGGGFTINSTNYNSTLATGVSQFRHATWDNGTWQYFENGTLIATGNGTPGNVIMDRLYLRGTTSTNYSNNNVSPMIHDNIIAYAGVLSKEAIQSLAKGNMPDSTGNLYA